MKSFFVIILVVIGFVQAKDLLKYSPNNIDVIPRKITVPEVRIVGGNEAEPHSFPHAVGVFVDGKFFCGGSIITKDVILTAARWIATAKSVEIVAGAHNINNKNETTQQIRTSTTFVVHENYKPKNRTNDIALIRLNTSLDLNNVVSVIQLDEGDCLDPGLERIQGTVAGWGKFGRGDGISPVLRFITNEIMTSATCRLWFSGARNTNICLSGSGGKGTCNGDEGSALFVTRNGIRIEVGLASYESGFGCDIGLPSVFTRVACYKEWIKSKL